MGMSYAARAEMRQREERAVRDRQKLIEADRAEKALHDLAAKITMIVIDEINRVIVRPGPVAEERECYEMAQEVRDHDEQLTNLVADIIRIAVKERKVKI